MISVAAPRVEAAEPGGIAILPLRSRGLTPAEHKRVQSKIATAFRDLRPDVLGPEEIAARLSRDDRQRAAFDEAKKLSGEGEEKSRALEHRDALERYDRAIALYRDHFGEYADPSGFGEMYIRRGAERLSGSDSAGARSDFFSAVTVAPDLAPSLDDFPPPVVEGWESARNERGRRVLPVEDAQEIAGLAAALGLGFLASARAERADRADDVVVVDLALWPAARGATARVARATLGAGDPDALVAAVRDVAGPPRAIAVATRPPEIVRNTDPARVDPIRRPPPRRRGGVPLWRNPWVLGGAALLVAGAAGVGIAASSQKPNDPGYRVIVTPGS